MPSQPNRAMPPLTRDEEPAIKPYRGGVYRKTPAVQQRSTFTSLGAHIALILLMWLGLPDFMKSKPVEPEPISISIEPMPFVKKSNVKVNQDRPLANNDTPSPPSPRPPVPPHQSQSAPPTPPAPASQPKDEVAPPPPDPLSQVVIPPKPLPPKAIPPKPVPPKPKPAPPKPTPPKEEKKDKDEETLDDVLKDIRQQSVQSHEKPPKKVTQPVGAKTISSSFDPNSPQGLALRENIMNQIKACWNPPAGVKDDYTLTVQIRAHFSADGALVGSPEIASGGNRSNPAFNAAASAAVRAVARCSPLKGLPADMYGGSTGWNDVMLNFNPQFLQ